MSTSCSGNGMAFFPANFMLQQPHNNDTTHDHQHPPSCSTSTCLSSLLPSCSAAHHQDFHGAGMGMGMGMGMAGAGKRSMSSFPTGTGVDMCDDQHEEHQNPAANGGGDEDLSDDGSLHLVGGEKKRRLNMEQVRTLEKNFELANKLEPERKMQLAKALGLQPRQIAIWFQNRRARWKTKQLEKDYDILKKRFDALKSDNDALHSQNQKLQAEIVALKNNKEPTESINLNKENTEGSSSNRSENNSHEIKLEISRTPAAAAPYLDDQYQSSHSPLSAAPASASASAHHHHHHHHQPTSSMPLFPPSSSSPTGVLPNMNRHINAGGPHHRRLHMTMAAHEEQRTFQGATTIRSDVDQVDRFDNHPHHQSAAAAVHVKEENNNSFSNMFVGIVDDQSGFWPWLEQHSFN